MDAYWDTSALLALIYIEPHSAPAQRAATKTTRAFTWWWLQVEAEAAMARRGATSAQRQTCRQALKSFIWVDLPRAKLPELLALNQKHRLRAADGGHLFCLKELFKIVPDITLVCFDNELVAAAKAEKIAVM